MRIAAFYRFVPFTAGELPIWRERLLELAEAGALTGTVLLAAEGINGTISGPAAGLEALFAWLRSDPRLAALEVKYSDSDRPAFHRLKVRLKREIVSLGLPELQPYLTSAVGTPVPPAQWDALIQEPGTLVIDTRNYYEVAIGTFEGALDPGTDTFRDFPRWVEQQLRPLVEQEHPAAIAMFCTGGIRCEKATAYLQQQGFAGVHQLQGGILRYLEEIPQQRSSWRGECFVFDQRVALNHQLQPGEHHLCYACGLPLAAADLLLPSYVEGVSCRHCLERFSDADRARFAERQRQMQLARGRGEGQLYPTLLPEASDG